MVVTPLLLPQMRLHPIVIGCMHRCRSALEGVRGLFMTSDPAPLILLYLARRKWAALPRGLDREA